MPAENIERAIKKASEAGAHLDELIFEAYGPGGSAILIEALTDNRNRTVAEVKHILSEHKGKWAETGSVRWAFEPNPETGGEKWQAKFSQDIGEEDAKALDILLEKLEEHDDVQSVFTNAA